MARGKHREAAQRRYDRGADEQIAALREKLIAANRARRDAEERAAQADALRVKLEEVAADRDAAAGPEVRRLNEMVVSLQDKLREADERAALKGRQVDAMWEKVFPFLPGKLEERFEWLMDALPTVDGLSGAAGKAIRDPRTTANKATDTRYQYLMQRIKGRRANLTRPIHTTEARMADALDRAPALLPDFPAIAEAVEWLVKELGATRDLLRNALDLLLAEEPNKARDMILEALSEPPEQPTKVILLKDNGRPC